ncbi:MAG: glutamine ABC transporter substrate-binding protein [Candidatus Epulonipiscium fishelsonii]|nr:MAG: glutamine ABC transporter substrate-binding protein [Epulopiscium sp. AS2M-Bin002]
MKKSILFLLGTVLTGSIFAGCSSSSAKTTSADTIENDKTWIIATDTVYIPFEYTNANNEFVGIDVDLLDAIAQDQNFDYELHSLGWDAAVAAVQAGQADGLIAGATINQERKDSGWIFSDGYFNTAQTFTVAKESDISSFEDLRGKNVAIKNGTAGASFANSIKDKYGFTTTVFEDSPTMYQDVILGNSAACVEDTPVMAASIKTGELDLKIPEGMESESSAYGFAIMSESARELLDMFNSGLANVKASGQYDEIINKYLKED